MSVQLPPSAVNMALLAFAAERRAAAPLLRGTRLQLLSIDICSLHCAQRQTRRWRRMQLQLLNDGTDGHRPFGQCQ